MSPAFKLKGSRLSAIISTGYFYACIFAQSGLECSLPNLSLPRNLRVPSMPNTTANSYFRSLPWFPPVPTHPRQMNHLPWNHHTTVLACITLTVVSSHEAESSSYLAQNLHSIQQMFDKLAYLGLSPTPQNTFYRSHSSESFTINLTLLQNKPGDSQGTCDTGLAFPVFPGLLVCESADDSLCTATT